jgi:hypothetical protein
MGNDFEEIHWRHIVALAMLLDVDPVKLVAASANSEKIDAYQEKMLTGGFSILGNLISSLPDKVQKTRKTKKTIKK